MPGPRRLYPTMLVLLSVGFAFGVFGAVCYQRGQRIAPLHRFLDAGLAPLVDECFVAYAAEYSLRSTEYNDVIFLGDSLCHDDIDPARLTGVRSYNLGSQGSIGSGGLLITAKGYLDHHPAPRAMILCISPLRFEVSSNSAGGHVGRRFVAAYGPEVPGVVPLYQSIEYFTKRGAIEIAGHSKFIPKRGTQQISWHDWGEIKFDAPLRGFESETYYTLERKMQATRGFFALPGEHGKSWAVEMPAPPQLILPEWLDAMQRLAGFCKRAGVLLIVHFGPIWAGVADSRDFSILERWAGELEASFANVRVVRPIVIAWDREVMWDAIHLNRAGVERFAPLVAEDVQTAVKELDLCCHHSISFASASTQ